MCCFACLNLRAQRTYSADSVCSVRLIRIWGRDTKDELVEEMVDREHLGCRISACAVNVAVKCCIRHVESGFPDVRELWIELSISNSNVIKTKIAAYRQ